MTAIPRSLVWATDIDVLPADRVVERHDGYLVVRSPSNPAHYWGNFLLFDAPPATGEAVRWEQCFRAEFRTESRVEHCTLGWDRTDGVIGQGREEFLTRGYELEQSIGLVGTPDGIRAHPRENREVVVRALDPHPGATAELWDQVVELQVAARDPRIEMDVHRAFSRRRLDDLRALFCLGRGAWFVALDRGGTEVQAGCGLVVTGGRGRFQAVDTAAAHRRKGICSRLVVEAARLTHERHGTEHFVIAADPDYHALGLYESLGFRRAERVAAVLRRPVRR